VMLRQVYNLLTGAARRWRREVERPCDAGRVVTASLPRSSSVLTVAATTRNCAML
jgi:hypothetical protein